MTWHRSLQSASNGRGALVEMVVMVHPPQVCGRRCGGRGDRTLAKPSVAINGLPSALSKQSLYVLRTPAPEAGAADRRMLIMLGRVAGEAGASARRPVRHTSAPMTAVGSQRCRAERGSARARTQPPPPPPPLLVPSRPRIRAPGRSADSVPEGGGQRWGACDSHATLESGIERH